MLCTVSLVLSLLPAIKGTGILPHSVAWNGEDVFKSHIIRGKFAFFLSNSSIVEPDDLQGTELSNTNVLIGIGHILVFTYRYIGAYFIELGLFFSVIPMCTK
jgi:hypothetical protein